MTFTTGSSKARAQDSVNKLFSSLIPDININAGPKKTKSNAEQLSSSYHNQPQAISKSQRQKKNAQIKKKREEQKKFSKLVKYQVIKSHRTHATDDEQKYLQKLVKRNVSQLKRLDGYEDLAVEDEIKELEDELRPEIEAKQKKRLRGGLLKSQHVKTAANFDPDFENKVKKGWISVPGLTPGLAPVDYVSSDEEED